MDLYDMKIKKKSMEDKENLEDDLCSICLCLFSNSQFDTKTLCCKHRFHTHCFISWETRQMKNQSTVTCPMCRHVVKVVNVKIIEIERNPLKMVRWLTQYIIHDFDSDYLCDLLFRVVIYIALSMSESKSMENGKVFFPDILWVMWRITFMGITSILLTFFQATLSIDAFVLPGSQIYAMIVNHVCSIIHLNKALECLRLTMKLSMWMIYSGTLLMCLSTLGGIMNAPIHMIGVYDQNGRPESFTTRRKSTWKHVMKRFAVIGLLSCAYTTISVQSYINKK